MKHQALKIIFDTTSITIDELCEKYNVTKEELSWYQEPEVDTSSTDDLPIKTEIVTSTSTLTQNASNPGLELLPLDGSDESILQDIKVLKSSVIQWAKDTMASAESLEVKEIKDLMSIVNQVESSLIVKNPDADKPTVNVFIQNMISEYKDDI